MAKNSYNQYWNDPRWLSFSNRLKEKYNFKCQVCGYVGSNLRVHHLKYDKENPNRRPWEYYENNLTVLCEGCHDNHHNKQYATSEECGPKIECMDMNFTICENVKPGEQAKESSPKKFNSFTKKRPGKSERKFGFDFHTIISEADALLLTEIRSNLEKLSGLQISTSRLARLLVRVAMQHVDELDPMLRKVYIEIW